MTQKWKLAINNKKNNIFKKYTPINNFYQACKKLMITNHYSKVKLNHNY